MICYQNNPAEFTLGKDLAAYFKSLILRKKIQPSTHLMVCWERISAKYI